MDIHELVRPKFIALVLKNRFQFASARGLVNLVIYSEQFSAGEFCLVITAVSIYLQRTFAHMLRHGWQLVFRQRK